MPKIDLQEYQKEALRLAIKVPYNEIFVQTGRGKSIIGTFYARYLLNKKLVDKVIFASTKTGVLSFKKAFTTRLGVNINQYDDEADFLRFFKSDEKICLVKHSMIEKMGFNQANIDYIRETLSDNYKRIAIVIDEVHKFSNDTSNLHQSFMNIRFAFERISLHTATPYGSCLSQLWGITHLIYPKLWRSKRAFFDDHIEEKVIMDYRTRRVMRKEKVAYKNLDLLRKKIEPFTYFYYPPLDLNFVEHRTRLNDYEEYDALCMGVLSKEDLEDKKDTK